MILAYQKMRLSIRNASASETILITANFVNHALYLAEKYAKMVDVWNGDQDTVIAINPNSVMMGKQIPRTLFLDYLIAEAHRKGYYVM